MKKVISAILASVMALSSTAAFAKSRTVDISEALSVGDEIHIIYNDAAVKYDDVKPINRQDRVMIPFRAALETMDASVDYDDATRTVTAKKGDITINFTLMSDTINIDKNGEKSQITMDVPMIIESDRTFVPIRFMSNALGMQVGWDGDSQTVVIADYDDYLKEFAAKAPNLFKVASLKFGAPTKNASAFDVSLDTKGEAGAFQGEASGSCETAVKDGKASAKATVSLKGLKLDMSDVNAQVVLDGKKMYVKTNALADLAKIIDNDALKAAAAALDENTWYSVDIAKLLENGGVDSATLAAVEVVLQTQGGVDMKKTLMSNVKTEGDATLVDIQDLATMLDVFEAMDSYIKVNANDEGYSVSVDITPEKFLGILAQTMGGDLLSDQDKAALAQMFNVTIKADIEKKGNSETSKVNCDIAIADGNGKSCKLKLDYENQATGDEGVENVEVPSDALDITAIVSAALK